MLKDIQFKLNNQTVNIQADGSENLLWLIRYHLHLTGTKYGCGQGDCGACTILVENEPVRACMTFLEDIANKEVTTIEGLVENDALHPVQEAFVENDAMQCGFCTPGMIMTAVGIIHKSPKITDEEIRDKMNLNLCRCGSYARILTAIRDASKKINGNS